MPPRPASSAPSKQEHRRAKARAIGRQRKATEHAAVIACRTPVTAVASHAARNSSPALAADSSPRLRVDLSSEQLICLVNDTADYVNLLIDQLVEANLRPKPPPPQLAMIFR